MTPVLGLAPFLRLSLAGADLRPIAQDLLDQARQAPADAGLWMNLSVALQCLGQRASGRAIQAQALALQRHYPLPSARQTDRLRILVLMVPGDLDANTPLDCLFEDDDGLALTLWYLDPERADPLAAPPPHDLLMLALAADATPAPLLAALERRLVHWPRPVINRPERIRNTDRARASRLLRAAPGLYMPPTVALSRASLRALAAGRPDPALPAWAAAAPFILRPVGSQAGRDLDRIATRGALADYLDRVAAADYFISPFVDYRGSDGYFRKFRIALVAGEPFVCHLAVSTHWMVHYVNAGMYTESWKRAEEAAFMAGFADFARRHRPALAAIQEQIGLDYVCIDGAELADGRLLIFEIDHAMVVHAMDPVARFPDKPARIAGIRRALRALFIRRSAEIGPDAAGVCRL